MSIAFNLLSIDHIRETKEFASSIVSAIIISCCRQLGAISIRVINSQADEAEVMFSEGCNDKLQTETKAPAKQHVRMLKTVKS